MFFNRPSSVKAETSLELTQILTEREQGTISPGASSALAATAPLPRRTSVHAATISLRRETGASEADVSRPPPSTALHDHPLSWMEKNVLHPWAARHDGNAQVSSLLAQWLGHSAVDAVALKKYLRKNWSTVGDDLANLFSEDSAKKLLAIKKLSTDTTLQSLFDLNATDPCEDFDIPQYTHSDNAEKSPPRVNLNACFRALENLQYIRNSLTDAQYDDAFHLLKGMTHEKAASLHFWQQASEGRLPAESTLPLEVQWLNVALMTTGMSSADSQRLAASKSSAETTGAVSGSHAAQLPERPTRFAKLKEYYPELLPYLKPLKSPIRLERYLKLTTLLKKNGFVALFENDELKTTHRQWKEISGNNFNAGPLDGKIGSESDGLERSIQNAIQHLQTQAKAFIFRENGYNTTDHKKSLAEAQKIKVKNYIDNLTINRLKISELIDFSRSCQASQALGMDADFNRVCLPLTEKVMHKALKAANVFDPGVCTAILDIPELTSKLSAVFKTLNKAVNACDSTGLQNPARTFLNYLQKKPAREREFFEYLANTSAQSQILKDLVGIFRGGVNSIQFNRIANNYAISSVLELRHHESLDIYSVPKELCFRVLQKLELLKDKLNPQVFRQTGLAVRTLSDFEAVIKPFWHDIVKGQEIKEFDNPSQHWLNQALRKSNSPVEQRDGLVLYACAPQTQEMPLAQRAEQCIFSQKNQKFKNNMLNYFLHDWAGSTDALQGLNSTDERIRESAISRMVSNKNIMEAFGVSPQDVDQSMLDDAAIRLEEIKDYVPYHLHDAMKNYLGEIQAGIYAADYKIVPLIYPSTDPEARRQVYEQLCQAPFLSTEAKLPPLSSDRLFEDALAHAGVSLEPGMTYWESLQHQLSTTLAESGPQPIPATAAQGRDALNPHAQAVFDQLPDHDYRKLAIQARGQKAIDRLNTSAVSAARTTGKNKATPTSL